MSKKRPTQHAVDSGRQLGHQRLTLHDAENRLNFLIDTGAAVSTVPPRPSDKQHQDIISFLTAANSKPIITYGHRTLPIRIGNNRILWRFIVADIPTAILGLDFLTENKMLIDPSGRTVTAPDGTVLRCNVQPSSGIRLIAPESEYAEIVLRYQEVSRRSGNSPGFRNTHHIETKGAPVFARPRRLCPDKAAEVKRQISELLAEGVIRPSSSNWSSPIHLVPKSDGSWRMCGDYRALNTITVPDRYPVPYLQDFTYILFGCTVFSKVDLLRAFHQVPVEECDIPKTAICTPFGAYEYLRMPFGLRNAAQTQQRLMDEVFLGLNFVFVYLDDILIASKSAAEHRAHLLAVFERIQQYGLIVNLKKSQFGRDNIEFLGHHVNSHGITPTAEKVASIVKFPAPKTVADMRRFLGMLNFYRRFIPNSASHQLELQSLITSSKKNDKTPIVWTPQSTAAFVTTKESIAQATMLCHPAPDAELSLVTDASDTAIGGALHQTLADGTVQPLGFFSRKLSKPQLKYSTFDRELEAVSQAIKHFDYWLDGRNFVVYTDHKPLCKAMEKKSERTNKRQAERFYRISSYNCEIRYLPGKDNLIADALSRIYHINASPAIDMEWIAALQDDDPDLLAILAGTKQTSLQLNQVKCLNSEAKLWCDTSNGQCRPFVPEAAQRIVMEKLHSLAHPGPRATAQLVSSKYVWLKIDKACREYARNCLACQRNKVNRHNHTELGKFDTPDARFQHVHMDIVGPLPTIDGQSYVLTMVDRYTRWPEAVTMPNITAETTASHFIETWIARYGVPTRITTDQGRQFTSDLFNSISSRLGIEHLQTTPYHPQSNGLVERMHRTLKAAIRCQEESNWVQALPIILLAMRSQPREDMGASASQMVYGSPLRIPGEFMQEVGETSHHKFVEELSKVMSALRPCLTSNNDTRRPIYRDKNLDHAKFVFIRVDAVKTPLQSPYTGPYRVLQCREKTFKVEVNGKPKEISVDRLKVAVTAEQEEQKTDLTPQAIEVPSSTRRTRSGRVVIPPSRLGGV